MCQLEKTTYTACAHAFIVHEVACKPPYTGCDFIVKITHDGEGMCTNCKVWHAEAQAAKEAEVRGKNHAVMVAKMVEELVAEQKTLKKEDAQRKAERRRKLEANNISAQVPVKRRKLHTESPSTPVAERKAKTLATIIDTVFTTSQVECDRLHVRNWDVCGKWYLLNTGIAVGKAKAGCLQKAKESFDRAGVEYRSNLHAMLEAAKNRVLEECEEAIQEQVTFMVKSFVRGSSDST